jgi:mevalonate pyrophosphate decarboxylase
MRRTSRKSIRSLAAHDAARQSPLFGTRAVILERELVTACLRAIQERDLLRLIGLVEIDTALKHLVLMSGQPPCHLLAAQTGRFLEEVVRVRANLALPVGFCVNYGPSVFLITDSENLGAVENELRIHATVASWNVLRPEPGGP